MRFTNIEIGLNGSGFTGTEAPEFDNGSPMKFSARFDLFLIREAWDRGASFEDLADGFGGGLGTMGGDWSGIRDSSGEAMNAMLERALNFLFPMHALRGETLDFNTIARQTPGFAVGDRVCFEARGRTIEGTVIRLNRKSISVQPNGDSRYWRVPPRMLERVGDR